MNKARRIITMCLAISLIAACAAFSYAAPTRPAPAQESAASEEELQRIAELSSDKYNHLLQVWSKDPNYPSDIDANFPDFYGGAYVDDNKELVITVTSLDEETTDYFKDLIDLEHVRFSLVDHSLQELFDVQAEIDSYLQSGTDKEICSAITGTGITQRENAVNVYVASNAPSDLPGVILNRFHPTDSSCDIRFTTLDLTFG